MTEWNIQGRARACQACGQGFADRTVYHTLLFEQRGGFERQDICGACWESQHRHGASDRRGFVSHWQGVYVVPPPPPSDPIQRDNAEALLRRLTEHNEPAWQPAAFILAVMLERKRVLKMREHLHHDGHRVLVYEMPRTAEVFTLPDPGLRLDQLEQVQRDVAHLLEHGLPPEPSPAEEPFVSPDTLPSPPTAPEAPDTAGSVPAPP